LYKLATEYWDHPVYEPVIQQLQNDMANQRSGDAWYPILGSTQFRNENNLITLEQVAELFETSTTTILFWIKEGYIDYEKRVENGLIYQFSRQYLLDIKAKRESYITKTDIQRWLNISQIMFDKMRDKGFFTPTEPHPTLRHGYRFKWYRNSEIAKFLNTLNSKANMVKSTDTSNLYYLADTKVMGITGTIGVDASDLIEKIILDEIPVYIRTEYENKITNFLVDLHEVRAWVDKVRTSNGWINLNETATLLGLSTKHVKALVERDFIQIIHRSKKVMYLSLDDVNSVRENYILGWKAVAEFLELPYSTVKSYVATGKLKETFVFSTTKGKLWLFEKRHLDEFKSGFTSSDIV
jgi:DNA-binding transcriptional MerR regulator